MLIIGRARPSHSALLRTCNAAVALLLNDFHRCSDAPRSFQGSRAGSEEPSPPSFGPLPTSSCRKLSPGSTTSSQL